jgi:hypothetical protein
MEELTMRFAGGMTIIFWPRWGRVAIVTPFGETVNLSLEAFGRAVKMARRARR